ncbi:MAG: hypothetical protein MJ196_03655 [Treponemataceae bacterium]|nr:hypothetical protein [Treponemataceae bacterium]
MDDVSLLPELEDFISLLTEHTGIIPLATHKNSIVSYIVKKTQDISKETGIVDGKKLCNMFYNQLVSSKTEFNNFVNESTVNETYFFREEAQFDFLRDRIFPSWRLQNPGKNIRIWSAACSTGEEIYSLALLARYCHLTPVLTASDIDTNVLNVCSGGVYSKAKVDRRVDGLSYHSLIEPYFKGEEVIFPKEIKDLISVKALNLKELAQSPFVPVEQDVIFLRNVFIYFSSEMKRAVLKAIADKCLKKNGLLFVSINEVASISGDIVPKNLIKENVGMVFYLRKI